LKHESFFHEGRGTTPCKGVFCPNDGAIAPPRCGTSSSNGAA
jgi:hypothetical protein